MGSVEFQRKNKPRKDTKFLVDYWTKEDLEDFKKRGVSLGIGCCLCLCQHSIEKDINGYLINGRKFIWFNSNKELKEFKQECLNDYFKQEVSGCSK